MIRDSEAFGLRGLDSEEGEESPMKEDHREKHSSLEVGDICSKVHVPAYQDNSGPISMKIRKSSGCNDYLLCYGRCQVTSSLVVSTCHQQHSYGLIQHEGCPPEFHYSGVTTPEVKSVVETRGDMGWDWFHLGPVQVLQHTLVLPGTGNIVDSAENIQESI